jgi:hypothetical protein
MEVQGCAKLGKKPFVKDSTDFFTIRFFITAERERKAIFNDAVKC